MESLDSMINVGIPYRYKWHILKITCDKLTRRVGNVLFQEELKYITESFCVFHAEDKIFGDALLYFTDVLWAFPPLLLDKHSTWLSVWEHKGETKDWLFGAYS